MQMRGQCWKSWGVFSGKDQATAAVEAYEKLYSEKDRKRIDRLKLPFKDFMKMIEESMDLIMGEDSQGEQ